MNNRKLYWCVWETLEHWEYIGCAFTLADARNLCTRYMYKHFAGLDRNAHIRFQALGSGVWGGLPAGGAYGAFNIETAMPMGAGEYDEQLRELTDATIEDVLDRAKRMKNRKHRVYFLASGERVKIGVTTNVNNRVRAISSMSPDRLEIAFIIPGDRTSEKLLHGLFAPDRLHGEWFKFSDDIREFIELAKRELAEASK